MRANEVNRIFSVKRRKILTAARQGTVIIISLRLRTYRHKRNKRKASNRQESAKFLWKPKRTQDALKVEATASPNPQSIPRPSGQICHRFGRDPVMEACAIAFTVVFIAMGLYYLLYVMGAAEQRGKRAVELGGGSISRHQVADNYKQYWAFFQKPKEIELTEKVPNLVDTFYNLVTDIYEWGWGQSFHFSPAVDGKSHKEETRLHEEMVSDLLSLKAGDKILDAGCGVGGPMRAIAKHSGANVVGITINDYQVNRARIHNKKAGLDGQCEVVCGNFLQMPFVDNSFDGAYSIEATCHAPRLQDVYGEIYRVLKPGRLYVSYEWVTTPKFRAENPEHVEIMHGIEQGDALPGIRNYKQIAEIAREVGFEVLEERDLALPPALPWWKRLKMGRFAYYRNHVVISLLSFLGIAPQGVMDVHEMLFKTAAFLTRGGETGIFTPMYMILCRKPES